MKRKRHYMGNGIKISWRKVRRILLVAGVCLLVYLLYVNVVAPYAPRWLALYGNPDIPEGYSIRGIDISHHQGEIDWDDLSKARIGDEPVSFVFVKATEGRLMYDDNFKDNFYEAREHGFVRGAYHYFSPSVPAKLQAANFLKHANLEGGDLPPVLDIEEAGNLSVEEVRQAVREWIAEVRKKYDALPIIYTYYKFKEKYLDTKEFNQYPYWIAHYYVRKVKYKGQWKFWQHTDCGHLPGIEGEVDLNVYNGSMYDLRRHCIRSEE